MQQTRCARTACAAWRTGRVWLLLGHGGDRRAMDYGSYWLLDLHHGALVYGGEWRRDLDTIEEGFKRRN
jgi:hypothetical protein